jgi:hypothetical protein
VTNILGKNVQRDKMSAETKCLQDITSLGQNTGQHVQRNKTSSGTKRPETKYIFVIFSTYSYLSKLTKMLLNIRQITAQKTSPCCPGKQVHESNFVFVLKKIL